MSGGLGTPERLVLHEIAIETPSTANGTAMRLLQVPSVFTQDRLLTSGEFVDVANTRGLELDLPGLQDLHRLGLLVPVFRLVDEEVVGRQVAAAPGDWSTLAQFAATGRVRDSGLEGWSRWWPYLRPDDAPEGWWDGYSFSPWQLFEVDDAQTARWLADTEGRWPSPALNRQPRC